MKAKPLFSPEARSDVFDIQNYISFRLSNPPAARRTIKRIREFAAQLRDFPEMGTPLLHGDPTPYRYLLCGSYMRFYRYGRPCVYVDRIRYGRRDYMTLLFGCDLGAEEPDERE